MHSHIQWYRYIVNVFIATGSTYYVSTDYLFTVTAKDATSTSLGVGGDIFFIEVTNHCTRSVPNYE